MTVHPLPPGAFLIDKPKDLTSSDVVNRLKRVLVKKGCAPKNFKIGHGGTLDPFATGVLAVLVGEATKLADCYLHSTKSYSGRIRLGKRKDTGDLTGETVEEAPVPDWKIEQWEEQAKGFTLGTYWQTPPMYSAKKQGGQALHHLARQGIEVKREPILKRIDSFHLRSGDPGCLEFSVTCESGTYVRVLAEDLAAKAGTLAYLDRLERTSSSDLSLSQCDDLDSTLEKIEHGVPFPEFRNFLPLRTLASHLPRIELREFELGRIRSGVPAEIDRLVRLADQVDTRSRYLIAGIAGIPVALLERSIAGTPFRLQRIFNHEAPTPA
jgi:tRNA pseudouridine55 synthase